MSFWTHHRAPGRSVAAPAAHPSPASQALCHNTIFCIVTQTGKWAVAHPISCTVFSSFFFSFALATVRPQKNYFFFFQIFQYNLKKLLFLFFFFTYCKTSEKIPQHIFSLQPPYYLYVFHKKKFLSFNSRLFCPKIFNLLRFYFLNHSVQHLSYVLFTKHIISHNTSCYTPKHT